MLKSPPSTPFDPAAAVAWARKHDPGRLLDTDSGGPANNLGLGDVNDTVSSDASSGILSVLPACNHVACFNYLVSMSGTLDGDYFVLQHDYPWPLGPAAKRPGPVPTATQYAMLGEMGGMGSFTMGHMWAPAESSNTASNPNDKGCFSYGHQFVNTSSDEARAYQWILGNITEHPEISVSIYTQTADVEDECDGFLNYDRTKKFGAVDEEAIRAANRKLIGTPKVGERQL
jgi:hypothetical protein